MVYPVNLIVHFSVKIPIISARKFRIYISFFMNPICKHVLNVNIIFVIIHGVVNYLPKSYLFVDFFDKVISHSILFIEIIFSRLASKESSFYTTLASATLTWNLINACIKGQINDTNCSCANHRQICQTDPSIAFSLSYLITDGLNMSLNFQQKFLFQLNQMNKELGRKVS